MTIDWSKPIQTYDGKKARVLCTDLADSEYPGCRCCFSRRYGNSSYEIEVEE